MKAKILLQFFDQKIVEYRASFLTPFAFFKAWSFHVGSNFSSETATLLFWSSADKHIVVFRVRAFELKVSRLCDLSATINKSKASGFERRAGEMLIFFSIENIAGCDSLHHHMKNFSIIFHSCIYSLFLFNSHSLLYWIKLFHWSKRWLNLNLPKF